MKVSVIIPAYNEEKYIGQTLKAILLQDHKDLEIIVVDNASTDSTFEIASKFDITVLREARKGTNFALECGRLHAKGEIIARLDADCLPDTDWVSKGLKHFLDPKVVALTGPYDYYDGRPSFRQISLLIQKYHYRFVSWLFQLLRIGAILTGGNSMMRGSTLQKIGGFDTSITFYGDDTDTARRLSKFGLVVFDPTFILKSSARRFKNEGTLKIFWLYSYHFLKATFRRSYKMVMRFATNSSRV